MTFDFREADYGASLSDVALIRREATPDSPIAEEELEEQQRLRPEGLFRRFELIYSGRELAGFWALQQEPSFVSDAEMHLRLLLRPRFEGRGLEAAAVERAVTLAKNLKLGKIVAHARSTHPGTLLALADKGFRPFHRDIVSRLVLDEFDPSLWQKALNRVTERGIRFACASDLEKSDPNWIEQAFRVHVELMHDVPFASAYTAPAFETWAAKVRNPKLYDQDLMFFAYNGARIVGETALFRLAARPSWCLTGLTAVVKEYRRQGIALALKVQSIGAAKELGIEHIDTGNEEGNPAYRMNQKLGYRDLYDDLAYALEF